MVLQPWLRAGQLYKDSGGVDQNDGRFETETPHFLPLWPKCRGMRSSLALWPTPLLPDCVVVFPLVALPKVRVTNLHTCPSEENHYFNQEDKNGKP